MAVDSSFVHIRQLFLLYFVFHLPLPKQMSLFDVDVDIGVDVDFDPDRLGAGLRGSLIVYGVAVLFSSRASICDQYIDPLAPIRAGGSL
jgi:hypothetical protein